MVKCLPAAVGRRHLDVKKGIKIECCFFLGVKKSPKGKGSLTNGSRFRKLAFCSSGGNYH